MNMRELVLGMQGTQDLSFAEIIIEVNNQRIPATGFIVRRDEKDNPIIVIKAGKNNAS